MNTLKKINKRKYNSLSHPRKERLKLRIQLRRNKNRQSSQGQERATKKSQRDSQIKNPPLVIKMEYRKKK